jgi:hypothetical protein
MSGSLGLSGKHRLRQTSSSKAAITAGTSSLRATMGYQVPARPIATIGQCRDRARNFPSSQTRVVVPERCLIAGRWFRRRGGGGKNVWLLGSLDGARVRDLRLFLLLARPRARPFGAPPGHLARSRLPLWRQRHAVLLGLITRALGHIRGSEARLFPLACPKNGKTGTREAARPYLVGL